MDASWIIPDWPAPPPVRSFITTRQGGVSQGAYSSMNPAAHVGDDAHAVATNRAILRTNLPAEPHWLNQVHGIQVARLQQVQTPADADAAVSRQAQVICTVLTADCLPVLLCDRAGTVVAAAHAGWRGLAAGVLQQTVQAMAVPGADIVAYLGPAIGPQAFEVGAEVRSAFCEIAAEAEGAFRPVKQGKFLADLYLLARQALARVGVNAVYGGGFCTFSEPERFFSFRRAPICGRMASLIWLA